MIETIASTLTLAASSLSLAGKKSVNTIWNCFHGGYNTEMQPSGSFCRGLPLPHPSPGNSIRLMDFNQAVMVDHTFDNDPYAGSTGSIYTPATTDSGATGHNRRNSTDTQEAMMNVLAASGTPTKAIMHQPEQHNPMYPLLRGTCADSAKNSSEDRPGPWDGTLHLETLPKDGEIIDISTENYNEGDFAYRPIYEDTTIESPEMVVVMPPLNNPVPLPSQIVRKTADKNLVDKRLPVSRPVIRSLTPLTPIKNNGISRTNPTVKKRAIL